MSLFQQKLKKIFIISLFSVLIASFGLGFYFSYAFIKPKNIKVPLEKYYFAKSNFKIPKKMLPGNSLIRIDWPSENNFINFQETVFLNHENKTLVFNKKWQELTHKLLITYKNEKFKNISGSFISVEDVSQYFGVPGQLICHFSQTNILDKKAQAHLYLLLDHGLVEMEINLNLENYQNINNKLLLNLALDKALSVFKKYQWGHDEVSMLSFFTRYGQIKTDCSDFTISGNLNFTHPQKNFTLNIQSYHCTPRVKLPQHFEIIAERIFSYFNHKIISRQIKNKKHPINQGKEQLFWESDNNKQERLLGSWLQNYGYGSMHLVLRAESSSDLAREKFSEILGYWNLILENIQDNKI